MKNYAPPLSPATPEIKRIGKFQIMHELGRGTVGSVYLGHDPVIDRSVAIKTFSTKLTPGERKQYEQHFINEARAAGRLSHPSIVTIFDASSEGGTTYIAMEYLRGKELSKILDQGKRFTPDETASIMWKMADALHYAHENGVVHRDIKPANIFMTADNHPKLVDFGIARAPNRVSDQPQDADAPFTLYRRNNLMGTPNYMSPEQAMSKPVDARTDVYSLGAVMYEMLAGCKPFKSSDTSQLLQQIAYKNPPSVHEVDPKTPIILSHIVAKAMSKRIEKRYQNAEEMALDIKRYMVREKRSKQKLKLEGAELASHPRRRASDQVPAQTPRIVFMLTCVAVAGLLLAGGAYLLR
jgi:serine/threonine-protein kinase